ncbi:MAG: hypothetical protein EZS28_026875 [Streblomastix strix]|uniref:RNase H type-1 domain-containing protein n=1 Tax=Streblomastix strix TaxID=222440 RepID=A0A5J4V4B5_9EUKA|nr:MAG: hypothetical protein EZS28_026875 [Streblomastix strix]
MEVDESGSGDSYKEKDITQREDQTIENKSRYETIFEDLISCKYFLGVKLSENINCGCISTYIINKPVKNRCDQETRMEWQDQANQENFGRSDLADGVNQTEQSERIRANGTCAENDNGCSGVWIGSCSGDDNSRRIKSSSNRRIGGVWNLKSSNQQELEAVLIGWRKLRPFIQKNIYLIIRTNNVVTEFVTRKWKIRGELLQLARKIRQDALDQDLQLITKHIPGVRNKKADALCRLARKGDYIIKKEYLYPALTELELNVWLYAFATRTNKRLDEYCSLLPDHLSFVVNAFSTNWKNLKPLLHPPIPQILRTLVKVQKDGAESVIILPYWKRQIWELLMKEMTVKEVVLGWADEVLEKGKTMDNLNLQLLLGKIKAVILISTLKVKDFSNEWHNTQDLMKTQLITQSTLLVMKRVGKGALVCIFFNTYLQEKKLELDKLLKRSADVILANCLSWKEKQSDKSKLQELRKS